MENSLVSPIVNQISDVELLPALDFCLDIFKNKKKFDSNKSNLKIYAAYHCKKI